MPSKIKMTLNEALAMAEKWTHDLPGNHKIEELPLFNALKTLLDQCKQQRQDIEELTQACRVLFRRNKELQDELLRSKETSRRVDSRS
jgi:hypothetical protein